MLDFANKYEIELKSKLMETWYKEKYKYYHTDVYMSEENTENATTWNCHRFVSLDKNKNVIGYFKYNIDRSANNCYCFCIINFMDKPNIIFSRDLKTII